MAKNDFTRAQERYADGELFIVIDGSGGMPVAFGGGKDNPFVVAVEYAVEARALTASQVNAYVFGEQDGGFRLPLGKGLEEPLTQYAPCGPSYFLPAFDKIEADYKAGVIKHPAQFVIVSDGEIYESTGGTGVMQIVINRLTAFLKENPEAMFDVIIPGDKKSELAHIMKKVAEAVPENPPRVYVVEDVQNLRRSMAKVINERCNAIENLTETMRTGAGKPLSSMSMPTIRFRKPTENA